MLTCLVMKIRLNVKVCVVFDFVNPSSCWECVFEFGRYFCFLPHCAFFILFYFVFCCCFLHPGSQDSKDGMSVSASGTDEHNPPHMPEETGKSKVASWLTNQGLKKVRKEFYSL